MICLIVRHSLWLTLAALAPLAAQDTQTIIDRARQTDSAAAPAQELAPAAPRAAPGADSDGGVQRVAELRRLPFKVTAYADQSLSWTDNVFLAAEKQGASADQGAAVARTALGVGVRTLPAVVGSGQLQARLGFNYSRALHGLGDANPSIRDLDFDSYAVPLGINYRWGQGWEAGASLTYNQLYSVRGAPDYEKLFASLTPALSLAKLRQLNAQTYLSLGTTLSYSDTWTDVSDALPGFTHRDDRSDKFDLGVNGALIFVRGPWVLTPSVRVGHSHYLHYQEASNTGGRDVDRRDTAAALDLSLAYNFNAHASVRLFGGYERRYSSEDGTGDDLDNYTYNSLNGGFGATLSVSF
jgi:hypothetical protein